MTRCLRTSAPQQLFGVDSSMKILETRTRPLVVDRSKLEVNRSSRCAHTLSGTCKLTLFYQELLRNVVLKTEGYEVDRLEKLYALLCQSIYRHRKDYDKTALIQVIIIKRWPSQT